MDNFDKLFEILDYLIDKYDIEDEDIRELQDAVDEITGVDNEVSLIAAENGNGFVEGSDEEE